MILFLIIFITAKWPFNSLKKKIVINEPLQSEYNQIIKNQLQVNVIEKLDKRITRPHVGQVNHLPHRSVV